MLAADAGHTEVVQVLLAAGANVVTRTLEEFTALHLACKNGKHAVVQQLLAAGADMEVPYTDQNLTPLHTAAGANKEARTGSGSTALFMASRHGKHDVVRLLLAAGAARNSGTTPLYEAALNGHVKAIQLLLQRGANAQVVVGGRTPLTEAAESGFVAFIQLLLEAWGQPPTMATALLQAALAAVRLWELKAFARLAMELGKLYPAELPQLFEDWDYASGEISDVVKAVLEAWASDVSSLHKQQAAVHAREAAVEKERHVLEQLVVHIAGMVKSTAHLT
jgi:hypothetical protein